MNTPLPPAPGKIPWQEYFWWHIFLLHISGDILPSLAPPPPPDRWSTKHFSSCSSSPASCRWPSILFASRSPSVQILMNFCSRQLLHAFDQFILSHPLSSHVFNLLHGDHHLPSSNSSNVKLLNSQCTQPLLVTQACWWKRAFFPKHVFLLDSSEN